MGPRSKAVALLMAVALACSTLFATTASAQQVDTSLSANPTATMSAIDDIGMPLSNQAAGEVRGAGLFSFATLKYLYNGSAPIRLYLNSYSAQTQFGWEWGRLTSSLEGNPDPGAMPSQATVNKVIYKIADVFTWTYYYFW